MGCDIHMMIERRIKSPSVAEQWATVNTLNAISDKGLHGADFRGRLWYVAEGRNYAFFGDLTNGEVRSEADGFNYPLRGVPQDVSPLIASELDYWSGDGHSASWLYADEFIPVFIKHCTSEKDVAIYTERRMKGEPIWVDVLEDYFNVAVPDDCKPSDFRFVFWFDN